MPDSSAEPFRHASDRFKNPTFEPSKLLLCSSFEFFLVFIGHRAVF